MINIIRKILRNKKWRQIKTNKGERKTLEGKRWQSEKEKRLSILTTSLTRHYPKIAQHFPQSLHNKRAIRISGSASGLTPPVNSLSPPLTDGSPSQKKKEKRKNDHYSLLKVIITRFVYPQSMILLIISRGSILGNPFRGLFFFRSSCAKLWRFLCQ